MKTAVPLADQEWRGWPGETTHDGEYVCWLLSIIFEESVSESEKRMHEVAIGGCIKTGVSAYERIK